MATALKVAQLMGGKRMLGSDIETEFDMADLVERGIPIEVLDLLLEAGILTREEIEHIVSRSTFSRRKRKKSLMTRDESDRTERYARIYATAEEVFANAEKARNWLRKENRALNGRRPLALIWSDIGMHVVEAELERIAHGVFA